MGQRSALIIGRGIIGLSLALSLHERGWRIVVLGDEGQQGIATRAATGLSSVKGQIVAAKPLFAAKLAGHRELPEWLAKVERLGQGEAAKCFAGIYEPFTTVTGYDRIRERVFHRKYNGCLNARLRTRAELNGPMSEISPLLGEAHGAFHYLGDGWFDAPAVCGLLERGLISQGVTILNERVRALEWASPQWLVHSERRTLALASPLPGTDLPPQTDLVVAAGVFSNALLLPLGLDYLRQEAVAGETALGHLATQQVALVRRGKTNFVCHRGRLVVGSSSRRCGDGPYGLDPVEDQLLRAELQSAFPGAEDQPSVWGVRGRFRDQAPTFGAVTLAQTPASRLWINLGYHKSGLQLGPLFGRLLAAQMDSGSVPAADAAFAPSRLQR